MDAHGGHDKSKILIVEDTPLNLKLLVTVLRDDYEIIVATQGVEALQFAESERPDLILLDVMMPEMDGYEVCRQLRKNSRTVAIPVIFVTSREDATAETMGLQLGAVDYVIKPFNVDIVRLRIKNQLELRLYRQQLEQLVAQRTLELEQARGAAEAGNQAKRDFLMTVSHELRTPLNQIMGFAGVLQSLLTDEESQQFLDVIRRASDDLLNMIDDILAFVSMEHTPALAESGPFLLQPLLQRLHEIHAPLASQKGVEFVFAVADGVPVTVLGAAKQLECALRQLISNAIKFTSAGFVRVEVAPLPTQDAPDLLLFRVRDTGVGVAAEAMDTIFQSFTQVGPVITRSHGGMGLGLAIFKRCLELMHGQLRHEEQPAQGSVFAFTVPLPVLPNILPNILE